MYRANFAAFIYAFATLGLLMNGSFYKESELYVSEGGKHNPDALDVTYPFSKWLLITLWVLRFIYILVSLRYPPLSKGFYYYSLLVTMVRHTMPNDYGNYELKLLQYTNMVMYAT